MSQCTVTRDENRLQISGQIDFDNAETVSKDGLRQINQCGERFIVDLAGLQGASSVGVSVLLSWMREAERSKKTMTIEHIPSSLLGVARVSGVDVFLPVAAQ